MAFERGIVTNLAWNPETTEVRFTFNPGTYLDALDFINDLRGGLNQLYDDLMAESNGSLCGWLEPRRVTV